METAFSYNNDPKYSDDTDTKNKMWRDRRSTQPTRKTSPPGSPIVIEAADLIRFLQTSEGVDIIAKAYNVSVNDFHNFVNTSKNTNNSLKGLLVSKPTSDSSGGGYQSSQKKASDGKELKYNSCSSNQQISPNTLARKRNNNDYFNFDKAVPPGVSVLQKKIKVENMDEMADLSSADYRTGMKSGERVDDIVMKTDSNNNNVTNLRTTIVTCSNSLLASLLTQNPNPVSGGGKKLVLTTKQHLLTTNRGSNNNNNQQQQHAPTYVTSRPVIVESPHSSVLTTMSTRCTTTTNTKNTNHTHTQQQQLSPNLPFANYPKISNPVSIKADRHSESEIGNPCDTSQSGVHTLSPCVPSITKPVMTSNTSAARNLNEINRTQSEKELMAMVDGDNVSADELCAEFKETLELSKWVDNENWYMDQYLQHFQVSPCLTSPDSSLPDAPDDSDTEDMDNNSGLIFAVDKEKKKNAASSSPRRPDSHLLDSTHLTSPVSVTIFNHHGKESGTASEVWSTLSSPSSGSCLSTSPQTRDGLLTSPRLYDGLLCSPTYPQGSSPGTRLLETGMDPNLIQPNYDINSVI